MQNLIKTRCADNLVFVYDYEDPAPFTSEWDVTASAGKLAGAGNTEKVGTGGSGSGLKVKFTTDGAPALTALQIKDIGKGYKLGDVVTFSFTAADNIATGSFDITLTIPASIYDLTQNMYVENGHYAGKSGNVYMNADIVLGWFGNESNQNMVKYLTTEKSGDGDKQLQYEIYFSGLDSQETESDEYLLNEIAAVISHGFKDAWQRPMSMFTLNDYLQGYFDNNPDLGIVNIILKEMS